MEAIASGDVGASPADDADTVTQPHESLPFGDHAKHSHVEPTLLSLPAGAQQMREFTISASNTNAADALSGVAVVDQRVGTGRCRPPRNDRQQHGHEQARSPVHLLRKALLAEVWTEDSHPNTYR